MTTPAISTLFLDVGRMLLTNGWDRKARARAAEQFGLNLEEMNDRHTMNFDTYELGKQSLEDYMRRVVFYTPRPFSTETFRQFMFDQSQRLPHMIEMVTALKDRYKLKIAVVSNEGRELTLHRVKKFRLGDFVDFFIFSSFVHLRKPDPDIFRLALDIAQVPPEEVVYIDDRELFVFVARELGIQGITNRNHETTRAALAGYGLALEDAGPVAAPP